LLESCVTLRKLAVYAAAAVSFAAFPGFVSAQMNMPGMSPATMETEEEIPPDQLPAPQKIAGAGNVHLQITANADAQVWFDQGLNLLHDFWDYESARAFEQSVRSDPNCAMCYWGLYKAESFYHGTSQGYASRALEKAQSLEKRANKHERFYIDASVASENAMKNAKGEPDFSAELAILRQLVKKFPKDTHARITFAVELEDGFDDKGEPKPGQKEALAMLESVMKDEPQNSAANHYYIHALEASAHPERAEHSAEILGSLSPASGHMVHMPGHIFYRMGDYARAEQAFSASTQVDEAYMRDQHVAADDDWNYVHNLMYAIANVMEEGKLKQANLLSEKIPGARGELEATLYIGWPRDSMSRLNPELPVALRTADWAQVLKLLEKAAPPDSQPNLQFLTRQLGEYARGMQAVEANDPAKAQQASARFDAELWRMTQQLKDNPDSKPKPSKNSNDPLKLQIMPDAMIQPLLSTLSIMSLELRGSCATLDKKTDEAKKLFAEAAKEEKDMGYREPPYYVRPVGETEAAALMSVGDWAGSKAAYERALVERPRSGLPLYGIALTSEKSGDLAGASKAYSDFLTAWKDADPDLAQLSHARTYIAEHPPTPNQTASMPPQHGSN
jgi:tetratricopeptide (TPR) repeat protein